MFQHCSLFFLVLFGGAVFLCLFSKINLFELVLKYLHVWACFSFLVSHLTLTGSCFAVKYRTVYSFGPD